MLLVAETFEVDAKSFVFPVTRVIKAEGSCPGKDAAGGTAVRACTARRPQTRLISKHEVD